MDDGPGPMPMPCYKQKVVRQPSTNTYFIAGGECYDTEGSRLNRKLFSYDFDTDIWTEHYGLRLERNIKPIGHGLAFINNGLDILITPGKYNNR